MSVRARSAALTAAALAAALACATPAARYDAAARELGFARRAPAKGADAAAPALAVYAPAEPRPGPRLHVYIEGDGLPRRAARYAPPDPTPPDALMLRLMALDPAPLLLLGRPCQHAVAPCDAGHWTLGRYGESVVAAMAAALRAELAVGGRTEAVLIGFSGGGALALLIAERVPETAAVVTLAGNLDVAAWTRHHGYAPLRDSLDPARRPPLPPHVRQLHLLAGRDAVVPNDLVWAALGRQPGATTRMYPDFDHACCWERAWPEVLAELAAGR